MTIGLITSYQGTPGFRFLKDLYPSARQGGLAYYPYSAIESGFAPTATLAAAAPTATPSLALSVAPGVALIDSQKATLATSVNLTINPLAAGFLPVITGSNIYRVFANPTRKIIPYVDINTPPTTLLNGDPIGIGDIAVLCSEFDTYLLTRKFQQWNGTAWVDYDPTFASPQLPAQPGKNRIWGGGSYPKLTATNMTVNAVEERIFIGNKYPPYTNSNSKALLRDSASLEVAVANLYYYVLPVPITVTLTNSSAAVTVAQANRPMVAALVASILNTNTLALSVGGQLAASGYNPATGVITLAAAYSGTSGTQTVNIVPQTAGNIYILDPNNSSVLSSGQLTNP